MEEDYDSYDGLSDEEKEMRKEEDEMWREKNNIVKLCLK